MAEFSQPPQRRCDRSGSITEPIDFKSSSSNPEDYNFKCSICQDVFTDPVTTSCGHNFCKSCLEKWWGNSLSCRCPLCNDYFSQKPELKINTALRELAESFKRKNPKVFCDTCAEKNVKALKSCLVCQTSYCETHLEPHQKVSCLKEHKLIDPVENLEKYICQKHKRPLELFCKDDQTCVCLSCTEGDHKTHNIVPIEEESEETKTQMEKTHMNIQQMIQDRKRNIQDMKESVKFSNVELLHVIEKQKTAEKQAEDLIKELQQEITELQRRDTELEQLSHTEDHLHLLQIYPSICSPLHTKNWTEISINPQLSMQMRRAMDHFHKALQEYEQPSENLKEMQKYAVDVTLDPDTAHEYLILSEDGKQARVDISRKIKHNLPHNPERFDICPSVLGKEGFSSGKFYFEVQVKGKTDWDLGVVRESIKRKGQITLNPMNGFWTVGLWKGKEYQASACPSVSLSMRLKPEKVGVFVDYEEGLVSFYDVESSSHIYSYTGQSFTEKLYPYFYPGKNEEDKMPLILSTASQNK